MSRPIERTADRSGRWYVTRARLVDFVSRVDAAFARGGRLYLIGETTQVWEGWRPSSPQVELTADVAVEDREVLAGVVADLAARTGLRVCAESPAAVIPLPDGYETLARSTPATRAWEDRGVRALGLRHFDPFSVAFRFIARGDEPDYHMVLMFLERGWLTEDEMDARLAELLPRFTAETIQQDPAEFRRKYQGLLQMWRTIRPYTTHRPTMV